MSEHATDGALGLVGGWPARTASAGFVTSDGGSGVVGPATTPLAWASVSKILTALAVWVAVEEGTVAIDQPAGPPGATVRHLLAHASGLSLDGDRVLGAPATRRIYSNRGIELVAEAVAAGAGMAFEDYLQVGVLDPLDMTGTRLSGSPASGVRGPVQDLLRLGAELLAPTLVDGSTLAAMTRVAFPGLDGVLPGWGRQSPNDWGLGVEVKGAKLPHWMPPAASPRTFGHFGQAGGFLWVDPVAGVAGAALTDLDFGPWAVEAWPAFGAAVLADHGGVR